LRDLKVVDLQKLPKFSCAFFDSFGVVLLLEVESSAEDLMLFEEDATVLDDSCCVECNTLSLTLEQLSLLLIC